MNKGECGHKSVFLWFLKTNTLLKGRKRRISDDEDMMQAPSSAADPSFQFGKTLQSSLRNDMKAKMTDNNSKRSKTDIDKTLSVSKLLGKELQTVLLPTCNNHMYSNYVFVIIRHTG